MSDWRDPFSGCRAVVLGASGFIGRWTVRALVDCGARVAAVGRDGPAIAQALGEAGTHADIVTHDMATSHLRSLLFNNSVLLPISEGKPVLGQFQSVILAELDGPRDRTLKLQILGE